MKRLSTSTGISDRMLHLGVAFLVLLFAGFLFYMGHVWVVTAGSVKVEHDLKEHLPDVSAKGAHGIVVGDEEPDEVWIQLSDKGVPSINEEVVTDLHAEVNKLIKDANGRKIIVTLEAHEKTPFGEITNMMDLLKAAGITNIAFTVGSDSGF